jgi:MoxR-like ATPase
MGRAIKVDGPPGTGKSELAKQIAIAMGLDVKNSFQFGQLFCTPDSIESMESKAIYSWNDAKRLIDMQLIASLSSRVNGEQLKEMYAKVSANSFGEQYLNIQVLLRACCIPYRTVCLVDEVDKTYHEFDNILLDIIDKNQFVIPEFGPVGRTEFNPQTSPIFVLTSNASRDLSGPLARRCNAVFYDYLPENLEAKVVKEKAGLPEEEAGLIAHFFKMMRTHNSMHLQQPPSTAEVIQTAKALKLTGLEVVETNLLKLHSHWIKCRMDYDSLCSCYKNINNSGEWSM